MKIQEGIEYRSLCNVHTRGGGFIKANSIVMVSGVFGAEVDVILQDNSVVVSHFLTPVETFINCFNQNHNG